MLLRYSAGDVVGIGAGCKALKVGDTVVYSKWGIGVTDLAMQGDEYAVLRELDVIGTFPSSGAHPRLPSRRSSRNCTCRRPHGQLTHTYTPHAGATAADVSKLTPLFDRVLVRVAEAAATSKGGVLLPGTAPVTPARPARLCLSCLPHSAPLLPPSLAPESRPTLPLTYSSSSPPPGPAESAKEKPVVGEVVRTGPGKEDEEMKLKAGDKVVYFKYAGDKMQARGGGDMCARPSVGFTSVDGLQRRRRQVSRVAGRR